jgi:hypothetical protein
VIQHGTQPNGFLQLQFHWEQCFWGAVIGMNLCIPRPLQVKGKGIRGPGAVPGSTDTVRVRAWLRCWQSALRRTFLASSGHFFFGKELFIVALRLPRTDLIFLGILFHSCLLPEMFWSNMLQTYCLISLYRCLNAEITSDILRASLKDSFKNYWHLCITDFY